jgi:hypothetical protein
MPKNTQPAAIATAAAAGPDASESPAAALCARADALFRAACECYRQHERVARLVGQSDDDAEQKAAYAMVEHCDRTLESMAAAYERASARVHPDGDDEVWWRKANALWHASREYARRQRESERVAKRANGANGTRDAASLATLNMDYELEASALLALKQALDGYKKVRPHAAC